MCSQSAASLVANKGDPFKTIESLVSVDTVKSLATSMISAGVVAKIASGLNIDITKLSKSDLLGRLEYNLAKNSVGAVVNLGMYGKYEQGAIGGVVDALLNSVLAPMLDKVDTLTAAADFSESSREWTRILVAGGVRGAITGRDTMDGILSGIAEEYVTAKCNSVVAEWEKEDKIREMAEALAKDGFAEDVNVRDKLAKDRFAIQDQASSSSSIKKPVAKKKYNASSFGNSSDASRGKTRERSQGYFSEEDLKYNPDDFISSIFTDPKALAEYEKYTAERGQYRFWENNDFSVNEVSTNRYRNTNKIVSFMFPAAYGSEKDSYHHTTTVVDPINLDAGFLDKILIGSGRAFVNTGQGIKQFGIAGLEGLKFMKPGSVSRYTSDINSERDLYRQTLVGQSAVAKTGEILADIAMYTVVPGGAGAKGLRFIAGSAMGGAFVGGMQATEDGSLGARLENAAFGAVGGAVGGYFINKTAQGVHWVWKEGKVQYGLHNFDKKVKDIPHVFSKAKGGKAPKYGHVIDTPENRRIIVETYMDKKNFIFKDKHGKELFAKLLSDGSESWVYIINGKIQSAGINKVQKYYNLNNSMKNKLSVDKIFKP